MLRSCLFVCLICTHALFLLIWSLSDVWWRVQVWILSSSDFLLPPSVTSSYICRLKNIRLSSLFLNTWALPRQPVTRLTYLPSSSLKRETEMLTTFTRWSVSNMKQQWWCNLYAWASLSTIEKSAHGAPLKLNVATILPQSGGNPSRIGCCSWRSLAC